MALQDPERDDNTDPGIAEALWRRAHPGEEPPDNSDDEIRRVKVDQAPINEVMSAVGQYNPVDAMADSVPSTDDQIANELASSPTAQPTPSGDPRQWDQFTDGSLVDGNTGEIEMSPVDARGVAATGNKAGGNVSYSHSGMAGGPKAVDDEFDTARKNAAAEYASVSPMFDQQEQRVVKNYGDLQAADQEKWDRTQKFHDAEAHIYDRLDDLNKTHLEALQKIQAAGMVERQRLIGEAKTQLAGVRQLMTQDPNPLHQLAIGEKIGLGAAAFAQGFLGARGINVDVTGQIDRWVERSMKEYQQKIQNARQGVDDTFHLYDVARQNSTDDYEGLLRYRAMLTEGAKVELQAHAARFQSDMAVQAAHEGEAKLNMDQDTTLGQIADRRVGAQQAFLKEEMDVAKQKGTLKLEKEKSAIGWYNAATQRMEAETKKKAADKEAMAGSMKIQDPSQVRKDAKGNVISGGKFIAAIDPNLPKPLYEQVYKRVTDAQQLYGELHSNLDHMKALQAKLDTGGPSWWKNTESQEYREWDAARQLTVASVRKYMSGTASSDKEGQMFLDTLPGDKWLQKGNNDQLLAGMDNWGRRHFNNALKVPGVVANDKEDEYAPLTEVNPVGAAGEKINESTSKPVPTWDRREYKAATDVTGGVDGPTADESKDGKNHFFDEAQRTTASPSWQKFMGDKEEPTNAEAVRHIVTAVLRPAELRRNLKSDVTVSIPDSDEAVKREGLEALERLSQVPKGNNTKDDSIYGQVPVYASKWLKLIKEDPAEAEKLLDAAW